MINISKNVLFEILSFLTPKEICIFSRTCKAFARASESDLLWQSSQDQGTGAQRKRKFTSRGKITHRIFSKVKQISILSGHSRSINAVSVQEKRILTCSEEPPKVSSQQDNRAHRQCKPCHVLGQGRRQYIRRSYPQNLEKVPRRKSRVRPPRRHHKTEEGRRNQGAYRRLRRSRQALGPEQSQEPDGEPRLR